MINPDLRRCLAGGIRSGMTYFTSRLQGVVDALTRVNRSWLNLYLKPLSAGTIIWTTPSGNVELEQRLFATSIRHHGAYGAPGCAKTRHTVPGSSRLMRGRRAGHE